MAKNLRLTDTVTIANTATVSTSITMEANRVPVAIVTPAAFTGTSVTFQASSDGTNFFPLFDEGTQYSVAVATNAARYIGLKRVPMDGVKHVRIVSTAGGGEAAIRTIGVISGE